MQRLSELSKIVTLKAISLPTWTYLNGVWSRFSISDNGILYLSTVSTIFWTNTYSVSFLEESGMSSADKVFRRFLKPILGNKLWAHTDFINKVRIADQEGVCCGIYCSPVYNTSTIAKLRVVCFAAPWDSPIKSQAKKYHPFPCIPIFEIY